MSQTAAEGRESKTSFVALAKKEQLVWAMRKLPASMLSALTTSLARRDLFDEQSICRRHIDWEELSRQLSKRTTGYREVEPWPSSFAYTPPHEESSLRGDPGFLRQEK